MVKFHTLLTGAAFALIGFTTIAASSYTTTEWLGHAEERARDMAREDASDVADDALAVVDFTVDCGMALSGGLVSGLQCGVDFALNPPSAPNFDWGDASEALDGVLSGDGAQDFLENFVDSYMDNPSILDALNNATGSARDQILDGIMSDCKDAARFAFRQMVEDLLTAIDSGTIVRCADQAEASAVDQNDQCAMLEDFNQCIDGYVPDEYQCHPDECYGSGSGSGSGSSGC